MCSKDYLYHYTNVEVLASILKNRTIRFSSLEKMDDLQEKETADIENIGQFCYVSSWTEEKIESIPMWNMYTDMSRGVRISLRKNPFMLYDNNASDLAEALKISVKYDSNGNPLKTLIPISEMFLKHFFCLDAINNNILHKVQYTSDSEKLVPKIVKQEEQSVTIALRILGKYKNLHWEFQKEWRYILVALPLSLQPIEKSAENARLMMSRILKGVEKQPFSYYNLIIADDAFSNMQITMSPHVEEGTRIIIENLIEKYNPSATLKYSSLVGLI